MTTTRSSVAATMLFLTNSATIPNDGTYVVEEKSENYVYRRIVGTTAKHLQVHVMFESALLVLEDVCQQSLLNFWEPFGRRGRFKCDVGDEIIAAVLRGDGKRKLKADATARLEVADYRFVSIRRID